MHLTLFQDAFFDGTYIDFDIVIADSSGLVPQTGIALTTDFTITVYDSAGNIDTFTTAVTSTEIGTSGIYKVRTTYSELNRAAGDGIWRWVLTPTVNRPDLTFEPMAVSITINQEIGTASTVTSTSIATFTGLSSTGVTHYKDSWLFVVWSTTANLIGEVKKITANDGAGQLTFGAMSAALTAGDKILIINR